MRVLWIDRVLVLVRARRIHARLELAPDEPIFSGHFPLRPTLPASVLLESFAQAGTFLLEPSFGFTRKALPGFYTNAKFHRAVEPGAAVEIEFVADHWGPDGALLRGRAEQRGARCATCVLGMFTAPLSDFFGPEHMRSYRDMYEQLLAGAEFEGFDRHPLQSLAHVLA